MFRNSFRALAASLVKARQTAPLSLLLLLLLLPMLALPTKMGSTAGERAIRTSSSVSRRVTIESSVCLDKACKLFGELEGVEWVQYRPTSGELFLCIEGCFGTFTLRSEEHGGRGGGKEHSGKTIIVFECPLEEYSEQLKPVENAIVSLATFLTQYCK